MKKILLFLSSCLLAFFAQAQIDTTLGVNAPKKVSKNYKILAHYLCDSLVTDYQKANAIYNWVTNNIEYDVKSIHRSKLRTDKPNAVLRRGKTICGGYADLITAMNQEVGIPAQTIIGYYKDWKFDEGDKFFIPNHAWNAIQLNNKWHYIDATAGAGFTSLQPNWFQRLMASVNKKKLYTAKKPSFIKQYDPEPFLPNIESFRMRHLSADPLWQLTDSSMPLSIFETNEDKIAAFNLNHSKPQQFSVELSRINRLDWDEQVLESANRTYQFNPRYTTMMARKKYVEAIYKVSASLQRINKNKGRLLLNEAKKELDETKDIQLKQRKTIADEILLLKQKNKAKTASFKKYKLELDKDNKTKRSTWRTKIKRAEAQIAQWSSRQAKLKKKPLPNSVQTIELIPTMRNSLSTSDAGLQRIADSVMVRNTRIKNRRKAIQLREETIETLEKKQKTQLNKLATYYNATDSFLYLETKARYEMHDDYDKEVRVPQARVRDLRLNELNSTFDSFISDYDSLKSIMKKNIDGLKRQEQDYKKNFKELEQYKRKNEENRVVLKYYNQQINEAQDLRKKQITTIATYKNKLDKHIELFSALRDAHNRELEFTKYMNLAENKRNELEGKKIKKDSDWLKAANKKTKQLLTETKKEADKLFKLRYSDKSKKWEKALKKLEERAKVDE